MLLRFFKPSSKQTSRRSTTTTPSDIAIPTHFRRPISLDQIRDPITLPTRADSERNQKCISSNTSSARKLSEAFKQFPSEQALSLLSTMCPLNAEARTLLSSSECISSILNVMTNGNFSARLHAVLLVKEIAAADKEQAARIAKTDGLIEAIMRLIKEPISRQATKASLVAAYYLITSDKKVGSKFAEIGIVSVLLEMIVDAEKGLCEKALVLIDGIMDSEIGREKVLGHALSLPVLAKKMLRVSEIATEYAVSGIWKLCREERWLKEAVQVGAFQKLLLLLQIGCSDSTKEKVNELLRMMKGIKGRDECIESADFKYLKRPF